MPGDRGTSLGLDLWELYRAGRQSLPAVAMELYVAANHVRAAGEMAESPFNRPAFLGGVKGPACGEWMELMYTIGRFLEDSADSIDATGTALVMAADAYAETDRAAGRELERLKNEHHTG
jgi:hypothetical protein